MEKSIKHTCGHTTKVEIDDTVKGWVKHYEAQKCFTCEPTKTVTRLCGHVEEAPRGFCSPRRMESAMMQLCEKCQ